MSHVVTRCTGCGTTFPLKAEYAGRELTCPRCGGVVVGGQAQADGGEGAPAPESVFDRNTFHFLQKVAINEKYVVSDEAGRTLLFVERPAHLLRNLFAAAAGIVAGVVALVVLSVPSTMLGEGALSALLSLAAMAGAFVVVVYTYSALSRKRHLTFFDGERRERRLLEVLQDSRFQLPVATYTIRDGSGVPIGTLRKNVFTNLVRKRWHLHRTDGAAVLTAREDSVILSLLRRFLGPLFGLLRTNFVFYTPDDRAVGEFNRKVSLRDRYTLDMTADALHRVDRRLALALAVMLDTGERR